MSHTRQRLSCTPRPPSDFGVTYSPHPSPSSHSHISSTATTHLTSMRTGKPSMTVTPVLHKKSRRAYLLGPRSFGTIFPSVANMLSRSIAAKFACPTPILLERKRFPPDSYCIQKCCSKPATHQRGHQGGAVDPAPGWESQMPRQRESGQPPVPALFASKDSSSEDSCNLVDAIHDG